MGPKVTKNKIIEVYREDGPFLFFKTGFRYLYGLMRLYYFREMRKKTEVISRIQDNQMILKIIEPGIGEELVVRGIREKLSTREIQRRVKTRMHIIEIGANIGYYVLMEAGLVGPSGKIYAVEPIPKNFELLNRNIKLNGFEDRVRTFNVAIGDITGTGTMNLSRFSTRHSFAERPFEDMIGQIQVPVMSFDDFLNKNQIDPQSINLIKIDVEGYEAKILPSMVKTIKECKNLIIFIEWHPKKINSLPGLSVPECLRLLKSVNARFDWLTMAEKGGKVIIRDKSIDDVLASEKIINNFSESWITIDNG